MARLSLTDSRSSSTRYSLAQRSWRFIISAKYLEQEGEHRGEYYALMLFAQAGMSILAAGHELVTLFVGLELMSLSFFVLVGFLRSDKRSNEAAIKYLLLGAFSSGLLAYGFSLFYGMSGSTLLRDVAAAVAERDAGDPMLLLAMITTSVGLLFQDLRRAVSYVGAGCLRRSAHTDHRVRFRGLEGCFLRAAHSDFPRAIRRCAGSVDTDAGGGGAGDHDIGKHRRDHPGKHEAPAGL